MTTFPYVDSSRSKSTPFFSHAAKFPWSNGIMFFQGVGNAFGFLTSFKMKGNF